MQNSTKPRTSLLLVLAAMSTGSAWAEGPATPSTNPRLKTLWPFKGSVSSATGLINGRNGKLYGTTDVSGTHFAGTVFELTPPSQVDGAWTNTVLYNFAGGADGSDPSGIILTPAGKIYGTAEAGGTVNSSCPFGCGTVFELAPPATRGGAWTKTTIYEFQGGSDGVGPWWGVIAGPHGVFYGATVYGGAQNHGVVFQLSPPGAPGGVWTESILYTFTGGSDGSGPSAVALGANGALYGESSLAASGNGLVFQLVPGPAGGVWTMNILYSFTGGSDGGFPIGGVTFGANGVIYGTTETGGVPSAACEQRCGTVFQLTPPGPAGGAWTEIVLYSFTGYSDGGFPGNGLLLRNGVLYGSTNFGGSTGWCSLGCGTVFQLTQSGATWSETVLHAFTGASDTTNPTVLLFDQNGNLDGVTSNSDIYFSGDYNGIIFQLTPANAGNAWNETVLYRMGQTSDGAVPVVPAVVFDANGVMYGATQHGGAYSCLSTVPGCGAIFQMTPPTAAGGPWTETILYSFGGGNDGRTPLSLAIDSSGVLYGVTTQGGSADFGTVFQLAQADGVWTETVLYRFTGGSDGKYPNSLVIGPNGILYGTTTGGGTISAGCTVYGTSGGCGTVFQLTPPVTQGGAWTKATIYSFMGGRDGLNPTGLAFYNGTLYGNTFGQDSNRMLNPGTVFQLTPPATGSLWTETVLHYFGGHDGGTNPNSAIVFDKKGAMYATTAGGGTGCKHGYGCGVVFRLKPPAVAGAAWRETVLYNFKGGTDGSNPIAVTFKNGKLVGSALYAGGAYNLCSIGCGTLFQLIPQAGGAWSETTLHVFTGYDGEYPQSLAVHSGKLYGTVQVGIGDFGTVFQLVF